MAEPRLQGEQASFSLGQSSLTTLRSSDKKVTRPSQEGFWGSPQVRLYPGYL